MTKQELNEKVAAAKAATKDALEQVFSALNQGQQKKLLKNAAIAALFERYGANQS